MGFLKNPPLGHEPFEVFGPNGCSPLMDQKGPPLLDREVFFLWPKKTSSHISPQVNWCFFRLYILGGAPQIPDVFRKWFALDVYPGRFFGNRPGWRGPAKEIVDIKLQRSNRE